MSKKSVIVGLPIVPFNQNKHGDVCQYLQYIQDLLVDIFTPDDKPPISSRSTTNDVSQQRENILKGIQVPLGGDLLGRERVSGAKKTRMGCDYPTERFENIIENVAQWHAKQSFLGVC